MASEHSLALATYKMSLGNRVEICRGGHLNLFLSNRGFNNLQCISSIVFQNFIIGKVFFYQDWHNVLSFFFSKELFSNLIKDIR